MNRTYLSCADTAKLVRQALKESFPGVKFSVRSSTYSGGASIDVEYTDGPSHKMVEQVLDHFEGSYFDGMIDYKGSVYHRLDGNPVRLGADFVHQRRNHSDARIARALELVARKYGCPVHPVEDFKAGHLYNVEAAVGANNFGFGGPHTVQGAANILLSKLSDRFFPSPSPTMARVTSAGDDGYGQGTVGTETSPGGEAAYKGREEAGARQANPILAALLAASEPLGNA